ncbi:exported protein of unknown function [Magnetospirillum sp. XM-1]|uniref:hypothetical protein n=1 Tax=Magnetospirillum sp. XM-1 TaxID=1663591 RepID=UPI00073DC5EF|nr:hypothetical protein [Magnetospirillum sp. XM-1]CUW38784.1 exported protein of unknown function [Magnetospirillum sp. XM-1]
MCAVLPIVAAAMSVAGAVMQSRAQQEAQEKSQRAMEDVQAAEAARQKRYQDSALQTWQGQLDKMDRPQQDQLTGQKTDERQALYDNVVPASRDYNDQASEVGASSEAPKVIQDSNAATLAQALGETRKQLSAKARLGGFADRTFSNAEMLQKGAGDVGMWGNFSKGSAGVVPAEMQAASRAGGSGHSMLGSLLSLGGMGLGMAGSAGAFGGASALGGASSGTVSGAGSVTPGVGSVGSFAPSGGNVLSTSYSPYLSRVPHPGSIY